MSPKEEGRLDSWKEIAEYLSRDVHTLLRWEKEKGLPVHTIPGGKRRTVYAYKHEIDRWMADSGSTEESPASAAEKGGLGKVWRGVRPVAGVAGLLLLLGLGGLGVYLVRGVHDPALTSLLQQGNRLVAISPGSSVAWTYDFPNGTVQVIHTAIFQPDETGRGAGVLVTAKVSGEGDGLYFFSPKGQPIWQFRPEDKLMFRAGDFGPPWYFTAQDVRRSAPTPRIAIAILPEVWWPSVLLVVNLQGHVEQRFINSGWIRAAYWVEGSGGPVLLISGISNSRDSGFFAVLDADHASGSSPEEPGSPYECLNCPAGKPLKYFLFPRSEVNRVSGSEVNLASGTAHGDRIIIITKEAPPAHGQGDPEGVYEFSRDYQLLRASYGDRYWELHRRLEKEGRIKHSRERCPERDGPLLVRQWDPKDGWRELHPNPANGHR